MSQYHGVVFDGRRNKWRAFVNLKRGASFNQRRGARVHLGFFDSEEAAAFMADVAACKLHSFAPVLNFPERRAEAEARAQKIEVKETEYVGVEFDHETGLWAAVPMIVTGGGRRRIGLYESELDAAMAHDQAAYRRHGRRARTNFTPEQLPEEPIRKVALAEGDAPLDESA
jgi:hypothetical protein